MRDIKFRCWNAHSGIMHCWKELVKLNKIHLLSEQKDSYSIMQYTGLKDFKGVEIYEGDIIQESTGSNMPPLLVIFNNGSFKMTIELNGVAKYYPISKQLVSLDELVVIGNKYENPELLK